MATSDSLAKRLLGGNKRALARAISLVENDDPQGWELVREVYRETGRAAVIGFTGPPGVGKSTLLAALTKLERSRGAPNGGFDQPLELPHLKSRSREIA